MRCTWCWTSCLSGILPRSKGRAPQSIQSAAARLNLDWPLHSNDTYLGLFQRLRARRQLSFRDLFFANFAGITVTPEDLGLTPGDKRSSTRMARINE